jgi:hypothetical protein
MDAEELLIHDRSEGQCAERVHAGIVQALGIFALTYASRSGDPQIITNVKSHTRA